MRTLTFLVLAIATLHAETGRDAWLRYAPLDITDGKFPLPPSVVALDDSPITTSARNELIRGVKGVSGRILRIDARTSANAAIVLGTIAELRTRYPLAAAPLKPEAFRIRTFGKDLVIAGADPNGILYGTF
ncbi:MAG TPA: alpha-glucuronidase family glycosyl hydrolase, partial [Bryobacteraceae bacterium]